MASSVLAMDRVALCARPGCQDSATAWLTYDYEDRRVWLDSRPDPAAGAQWPLCTLHAERLRVPQGWEQMDRRAAPRSGPPNSRVP